jgi:hypothetical protein
LIAQKAVLENLETIQISLTRSIEEGLIDREDNYYNEILRLIESVGGVDNWDDLMRAVVRARTVEMDIAAWMSRHGRNTISLTWPK